MSTEPKRPIVIAPVATDARVSLPQINAIARVKKD